MQTAILWDNDGVLVDSEKLFYEANRRYFWDAAGIELNADLYFEHFLCSSAGLWHLLRDRGWNEHRISGGRTERNQLYASLLRDSPSLTIPGIEAVLEHFAKSCRMAVVTSSARAHFEQIHHNTGLLRHFELVVAAGDYAREKPDPEPYEVAIARLGVPPARCIAVEDSPRGLCAAAAAGLSCIVVRSELTQRCAFEGAHAIVDSPLQLFEALQLWHERHGAA
jgi:HAD superfamily hydrolase (TIGR01509 family)